MENKTIEELQIIIGKKLEVMRLNFNYSQNELSKEIGMSIKTISSIEKGNNFTV